MFFDKFRIANAASDDACKEKASEGEYTIFKRNKYFDVKTSTVVYNGKPDAEMKNYLIEWNDFKNNQKRKFEIRSELHRLENEMKKANVELQRCQHEFFKKKLGLRYVAFGMNHNHIQINHICSMHSNAIYTLSKQLIGFRGLKDVYHAALRSQSEAKINRDVWSMKKVWLQVSSFF